MWSRIQHPEYPARHLRFFLHPTVTSHNVIEYLSYWIPKPSNRFSTQHLPELYPIRIQYRYSSTKQGLDLIQGSNLDHTQTATPHHITCYPRGVTTIRRPATTRPISPETQTHSLGCLCRVQGSVTTSTTIEAPFAIDHHASTTL